MFLGNSDQKDHRKHRHWHWHCGGGSKNYRQQPSFKNSDTVTNSTKNVPFWKAQTLKLQLWWMSILSIAKWITLKTVGLVKLSKGATLKTCSTTYGAELKPHWLLGEAIYIGSDGSASINGRCKAVYKATTLYLGLRKMRICRLLVTNTNPNPNTIPTPNPNLNPCYKKYHWEKKIRYRISTHILHVVVVVKCICMLLLRFL